MRKTLGLLMCFILKPFGFLLILVKHVLVLTGKTLLFQIEGNCINKHHVSITTISTKAVIMTPECNVNS